MSGAPPPLGGHSESKAGKGKGKGKGKGQGQGQGSDVSMVTLSADPNASTTAIRGASQPASIKGGSSGSGGNAGQSK